MTIKTYLLQRIDSRKADRTRRIPNSYFKGYRRLAPTASATEPGRCWCCKHAVAHVTWHCDRARQVCEWERCYSRDELTQADYQAGRLREKWLGLPSRESV